MGLLALLKLALRPTAWGRAYKLYWQVVDLQRKHDHFRSLVWIARDRGNRKMEAILTRQADDTWDELVTTKARLHMCIEPTK